MTRKNTILFVIASMILLLSAQTTRAQKQNNIWYFGDSLGIDFNSGKPKLLLDGVMYYPGSWTLDVQGFGDASIADRNNGKLLFYCSGHRGVFNRKHHLMSTVGDSAWSEIATIVPMGCDTNKYVIVDNDDGWWTSWQHYQWFPPVTAFSIIDMTLDSGYGDKSGPPVELLHGASDRLVAIPHANGTDSWIITHSLHNKYYYAWHVSARGVNPTPVLSTYDTGNYVYLGGGEDEALINSSPDGRHLVNSYLQGQPDLLNFDPATGQISYDRKIVGMGGAIGACFSADNSKLYVVNGTMLHQYDLASGAITRIDSQSFDLYAVQLGPDGKVYVCSDKASWLGVVNDPNALGTACNYQRFGFYLGGRMTSYDGGWLPNNMNSYPTNIPGACNKVTADFMTTPTCSGRCMNFSDWSNGSPTSWKWSFTGATPSTATGETVSNVCYDSSGFFPVTLIVNGPNGADTLVKSVLIDIGSRQVNCVQITEHANPNAQVDIPVKVIVPHSLGLDSASISEIDVTLAFDSTVLTINPTDLPARVVPPAGWIAGDLEISGDILFAAFTNPNTLKVRDSLDLGSVTFDVRNVGSVATFIKTPSIVVRTPVDDYNLCTEQEGNFYLAKVIVDQSSVSAGAASQPIDLSIHPDPVHGNGATISWASAPGVHGELQILDVLGHVIWQWHGTAESPSGTCEVEVPSNLNLTSGTYYARLSFGAETVTRRFVVER